MEKWINVKDKLPDKDGRYLVARKCRIGIIVDILDFDRCLSKVDRFLFPEDEGFKRPGWYDVDELYSDTFDDEYNFEITDVVAWMELPKAYKIEEEK